MADNGFHVLGNVLRSKGEGIMLERIRLKLVNNRYSVMLF